jgi:hypothetical protein
MHDGLRNYVRFILAGLFCVVVILPGAALADHFPAPDTNASRSADYLVNFQINGVAAQTGDEIAFFNPRGVLCGHCVVLSGNDYYHMDIYGYDDSADGEELIVKVWDASGAAELQEGSLRLTAGPSMGEYYQSSLIPPVWRDRGAYVLHIDTATHFPSPLGSPQVSTYFGNIVIMDQPASVGDEVAVFDGSGVLCGLARVTAGGKYSVEVYGDDDPGAAPDEGAIGGETLTFKLWDQSEGVEYSGTDLLFSAGDPLGSEFYLSSEIPPIWTGDLGYALDITVSSVAAGDIDGSGRIDLADVVFSLQICARLVPAGATISRSADVNGDGRIDLREAVYILQNVAELR